MIEFRDLKPGDKFISPKGRTIYMRTTECAFKECTCCKRNALVLADGSWVNFDERAEVIPVEC